jgi:hypothetical protein
LCRPGYPDMMVKSFLDPEICETDLNGLLCSENATNLRGHCGQNQVCLL